MNVTLRISDELGKRAKHFAIDEGKSLSAIVEDLLTERLRRANKSEYQKAQQAAWEVMEEGLSGGGKKFNRDELYDR